MASGNDQTIHEIFADNDSENEDEFEGFDPEDISIDLNNENNENGRTDLFDSEKWGVGSRQDQEPLTFSTVPGRRVPLPETTTVSDYFNIFIKDDDFEEIATETIGIVAGKNGVEVTGSVLQYSLMSDCEIIPIARISAM
jgi:hypothetical protein